jgi:MoaA/NifB/PqqE/SkfB family radical SAM enzyme
LEFFKRNFTKEFILANVEKITFCGDDGDPIYAHDLIPVIKYIKSIKPVEIVIVTNGSHKKIPWWIELGSTLDSKDSVHFSIDGYDNASNNLYRVNSDYESIVSGLQTLRASSRCKIVWAAIAFKFNEDKLDFMQGFAKELGVDVFQLTKSTKFGGVYPSYGANDPLQPSIKFVSSSYRFERETFNLSERSDWQAVPLTNLRLYNQYKDNKDIIPLWKAERWNPEELMKLYKRVGAKYFVSMGTHHDNFFLWNSNLHKWNSVKMGPHKDVVGLWQQAAKKEGLRFGISEHLAASYIQLRFLRWQPCCEYSHWLKY